MPTLQWRRNGRDSVSNHQPHDCLFNCLFRRRSKKISKLRVTGHCARNSPVNSPHKWPVTRKMFPFDDVIMHIVCIGCLLWVLNDHIIKWSHCIDATPFSRHQLDGLATQRINNTNNWRLTWSLSELKWSGGWSTGTVGWLSPSEQGQYLEGWPAMNTKRLVPLPFLPILILWSTENLSHGSPVLVPPVTQ